MKRQTKEILLKESGIVWMPLIIWSVVAIIGLAVFRGGYEVARVVDNTNKESILSATAAQPISSPTSTPVPTQEPVVNNQQAATTSQQALHNGTRTGNIIKYQEWCTGKNISIYENEILNEIGADGKTYGMTKGDWNCYWQNNNSGNSNNSGSNNSTAQYQQAYVDIIKQHVADQTQLIKDQYQQNPQDLAKQQADAQKIKEQNAAQNAADQQKQCADMLNSLQQCKDGANAKYNNDLKFCSANYPGDGYIQAQRAGCNSEALSTPKPEFKSV